MGFPYVEQYNLSDEKKCLCIGCRTPVCYMFEVIRNDYQCQSGKAYFVSRV